ncbi:MAG: bifunctional aldolase/short-chain dehydrogenase [Ilumatobacter sp.]
MTSPETGQARDVIDECVHISRRLGSDPSLVLHGGGNTSIKAPWVDITGTVVDALYVKGSGWDLADIEPAGFAPLPLARMLALLDLEQLSDTEMMRELAAARLDPAAPQPSVEALLHAFIPYASVLHSHADTILALTNLADGEQRVREVFGDRVVCVPYVMPGFELAREVKVCWPQPMHDDVIGMVLMNHGLFTFGDTADEAYERHVTLISAVERYLDDLPGAGHNALITANTDSTTVSQGCALRLAKLRKLVSDAAGTPLIVTRDHTPATMSFVSRPDLADIANRGPITPDHVIRTKRVPLVGTDVAEYVASYIGYFDEHSPQARTPVKMLDPAPRVVLAPHLGMLTAGQRVKDADIAADIYRHTMAVIAISQDRLGGWEPLAAKHLFDMEYWELEQAKLRLAGPPAELAGRVGFITGSASGIGRACAQALLERGAAVIGADLDQSVETSFDSAAWCGIEADLTDPAAISRALDAGVDRFGGVDIAVISAGIFGASTPIAELGSSQWRDVMAVNVDSVAETFRQLHPLLAASPTDASVVVIGSKNVAAPGIGAAAYSASKAAVTQLARVAALEWAADGIRVNVVHPDAVFDTGLWTTDLLGERAAKYDMTVEQYKRRNLLGIEVSSSTVAELVADMCGPSFAATTGAQIPIDGGNDRTV